MKKFSSLFLVLLLMQVSFTANAQGLYGDVNGDGVVNISDVNAVLGVILGDHTPTPPPVDEHEWVDLGLPSGTLWATCNVGADSPEDYGDYFAWGETEPKDVYYWENYKWCDTSDYTMTKYCKDSENGTVDRKTRLEPEDDAAYVNWGPSWRMPTLVQIKELIDECTWTLQDDQCSYLVIGPNGNTMFLPAPGYILDDLIYYEGSYGCFWSCELGPCDSLIAYALAIGFQRYWYNAFSRYHGRSVRPVRVPQN